MVYGSLSAYAGVDYNLTLCPLQIRLQHIYHGQPFARVDLNPIPESTLSTSQGFSIWPLIIAVCGLPSLERWDKNLRLHTQPLHDSCEALCTQSRKSQLLLAMSLLSCRIMDLYSFSRDGIFSNLKRLSWWFIGYRRLGSRTSPLWRHRLLQLSCFLQVSCHLH